MVKQIYLRNETRYIQISIQVTKVFQSQWLRSDGSIHFDEDCKLRIGLWSGNSKTPRDFCIDVEIASTAPLLRTRWTTITMSKLTKFSKIGSPAFFSVELGSIIITTIN